jgi:hypothetical protein
MTAKQFQAQIDNQSGASGTGETLAFYLLMTCTGFCALVFAGFAFGLIK